MENQAIDPKELIEKQLFFEEIWSNQAELDRKILYLKHIERWSLKEIASELNLSVAAVRNRVPRARAKLREDFAEAERMAIT